MNLTEAQRQFLAFYRELRRRGGPTFLRLLAGPVVLALVVIAQIAVAVLLGGPAWLAAFGVGILVGAALNSFKGVHQFIRAWPVIEQLTDWQRVDQLLDSSSPPAPPAGVR